MARRAQDRTEPKPSSTRIPLPASRQIASATWPPESANSPARPQLTPLTDTRSVLAVLKDRSNLLILR